MCFILNHGKTTSPIKEAFFSLGQVYVGKNRKILFLGNNFQFWEILNLSFRGEFCFGVLFSVWENLCIGNLKYSFYKGNIFSLRVFLNYM